MQLDTALATTRTVRKRLDLDRPVDVPVEERTHRNRWLHTSDGLAGDGEDPVEGHGRAGGVVDT